MLLASSIPPVGLPDEAETMSDGTHPGLSRRRLLTSIATIGNSLSAAGAGTEALFNDSETVEVTIGAGSVELSINRDSSPTVEDVADGNKGRDSLEVKSTGRFPSKLGNQVNAVSVTEPSGANGDFGVKKVKFGVCGSAFVILNLTADFPLNVVGESSEDSAEGQVTGADLKKGINHRGDLRIVAWFKLLNKVYRHVQNAGRTYHNGNNCADGKSPEGNMGSPPQRAASLRGALTVEFGVGRADSTIRWIIQPGTVGALVDDPSDGTVTDYSEVSIGGEGQTATDMVVDWRVRSGGKPFAGQTATIDYEVIIRS
ncbi:TasA family protein [Halobaculum sp. MBLA0147]|uniref:TasA family protein n=1 Tax=Halobaculum sp. MBLA0147 TaxID=3079934 RepID=UPI0035231F66